MRRCLGLAVLLAALLMVPAAHGAVSHSSLFKVFYFPDSEHAQYFEAPCGIAVRPDGGLYVADYYHDKIESFDSGGGYLGAETDVDPEDGPCGLAADGAGDLFVESHHGGVVRHDSSGIVTTVDPGPSTGIAYDPAAAHVYVDDRDHVAVYEESGQPVEVEGEPLTIGAGSLGDGYGVAVSSHAGTEGFVYVADAASDTIKVFDPATSTETPVGEIDGADDPQGGFTTLVDAALAVDDATGDLFVVYNAQGPFYVHPLAAVAEFGPAGDYLGTVDAGVSLRFGEPSGIAVDDTGGPGQGRVFVTTGNSQVEHPYIPPRPGEPGSPGKPEEGALFAFGPTVITPDSMTAENEPASTVAAGPEAASAATSSPTTFSVVAPKASDATTTTTAAEKHRRHAESRRRRHHRALRHRKARKR